MSRQAIAGPVRLVLAAAIGVSGAIALGSGTSTVAAGPADSECAAAGYDYGVKLDTGATGEYSYDGDGPWEPDGRPLTLEVEIEDGHNFNYTANPPTAAVLVKTGGGSPEFPGGSSGDHTIELQQAISHITFCYDVVPEVEDLTITKTVETNYDLTHNWSLDKSVDKTDVVLEEGGTGTVNWTVDVDYLGATESNHTVSGSVTVENTGNTVASVASLSDTLTALDCGGAFDGGPVVLNPDGTLTCTFSVPVAGKIAGTHTASATSLSGVTYDTDPIAITWGAPATQLDESVDLTDVSDVNGTTGPITFTAPTGGTLEYSNTFKWSDYEVPADCGTHTYDNTATLALDAVNDLIDTESVDVTVVCDADLSIAKQIDGEATLDPATGIWTIVYDVTVTNSGPGAATVDVEDDLMFGDGVDVESVEVANDSGYTTNADFDGGSGVNGGNDYIINGAEIAAADEVVFTVTVTATIPTPTIGAGVCDPEGVEAGGFLNVASLHHGEETHGPVHDCDPFSTLRLIKQVSSNNGGTAVPGDFTLTAGDAEGPVYVQGAGDVIEAVPAGTYELDESDLPGYSAVAPGFVCSTEQTGYSVDVPEASDVTCTITNDDDPVDVGIVKTHSGIPGGTVAPGESYQYVLDVTNHGDTTATDVVVTDQIPSRLTVTNVSVPAGWTNGSSGNAVSASVPSMAAGATAQIVVTVQLKAANLPAPTLIGDGDPAPKITNPPVESLTNTACVDADFDSNSANDCDNDVVQVDDIVAVVYVRCVNDAPLMGFEVKTSAGLAGDPIKLTWKPNVVNAGTAPTQLVFDLESGDSDEVAWPGAAFSPSGISIDYPGWRPIEEGDYVNGELPASAITSNGLILDNEEPDYAWRGATKLTFSVNPEISFTATYPDATPECAAQRDTDLVIEKLASQPTVLAGGTFQYTLGVTNLSDNGAAENVVLTDPIPSNLRVDSISTSSTAFPRWTACAVTGTAANGYGGTLRCELFGPLLQGEGAPNITLGVTVSPSTPTGSTTNTAVVEWTLFDTPDETGTANDSAVIAVTAVDSRPPVPTPTNLPPTGSGLPGTLTQFALIAMGAGALMFLVARRRTTTS